MVYPGFEKCIVEALPDNIVLGAESHYNVGGIDYGFNNPFCAVWGFADGDDVLWVDQRSIQVGSYTSPIHSEAIPKVSGGGQTLPSRD